MFLALAETLKLISLSRIPQKVGREYGPRSSGPSEIDGLILPPGIAYTLLTDRLITG